MTRNKPHLNLLYTSKYVCIPTVKNKQRFKESSYCSNYEFRTKRYKHRCRSHATPRLNGNSCLSFTLFSLFAICVTRTATIMNPLGTTSAPGLVRPLSPTIAGLTALHAPQQQSLQSQSSPNAAFLAGFSSRLASRQQQHVQPAVRGLDIFDNMQSLPAAAGAGRTNFGIPVSSSGPPSAYDINEFPSLSGGPAGVGLLPASSAPGSNRPNYVGQLVKENSSASDFGSSSNKPAFDMNFDFPALPGATTSHTNDRNDGNEGSGSGNTHNKHFSGLGLGSAFHSQSVIQSQSSSGSSSMTGDGLTSGQGHSKHKNVQRGIQTSRDGRVTNIPMGMVTDQFGMIGLLSFLRIADSDPALVSLALGTDLTNLKLDLNSQETLYNSFPGPWSDQPLKPYEIDYAVPSEYLVHNSVKDKLACLKDKLSRYGEDILFFLFYMFPNDLMQLAASQELFQRDWRYHKDEKVWITRAPGCPPTDKSQTYERGTYIFFDPQTWRRQPKDFLLEYDRLENRIVTVAGHAAGSSGSAGSASGPGVAA